MFSNVFKNKKIIVTGNTGFKGSWLTVWLLKMQAQVYGISVDIPTKPSMFEVLELEKKIQHHYADINDLPRMKEIIASIKPDFLFHLAAQPIVSKSYTEPIGTIQTNVMGTANILEALRASNHTCTVVMISSDKCYENVEWTWGYRETDHLGGKDPYSASKGACEIIIHTYYQSFFKDESSKVRLVSVRAGNVIGGGDWAEKRLVPDCIKAWSMGHTVEIRNPYATRPWQHVLEPLSGYLRAGEVLHADRSINGEPYNFGPPADQIHNVFEMLHQLSDHWEFKPGHEKFVINKSSNFHEAGLLKLNCDKSLSHLKWKPVLDFKNTTKLTALWYQAFYENKKNMFDLTNQQIEQYISFAEEKELEWTK
jgi:CDP-glucose 4,6-dehydratase